MGCESFTRRLRTAHGGLSTPGSRSTTSTTLERELVKARRRGVRHRAGAGQGLQFPADDFFTSRRRSFAANTERFSSATKSRPVSDAPARCLASSTGISSRTSSRWRRRLSGGYVPCGAIVTRREIYQKTFSRMDRCVVHSTTFGRNNLAMACGLAALEVIDDEKLVENSARMGALLMRADRCAPREALVHQGSARQRTDDRDRVPRAERVQAEDGLETSAQSRQGALCPDGRDPDAEHSIASSPRSPGTPWTW